MREKLPVLSPAWTEHAACSPETAEAFFNGDDKRGYLGNKKDRLKAMALCAQCPVAKQCLEDAILRGERHGIRGGKTTSERDAMARSIRRHSS
ncbi:transcription factor WhiB [Candidatus Saccharibacteria bacterium]|nr:MAG: transcription factor WhiB [Candidatus Saccharibacteria bacterium]